ncbi:hypothetical protein CONCODRAFT_7050 [Conidiobolus coronatus NRRL 28638]|uniref:Transcription factor domain-containing protein n=1 Tax=Conidiobolus coronatus (strain ATCC 28846 / CBS 209.66 / NRRL 28638) TaxID=796925 RepID=A0A137P600_CONC2|nr:hypothetical protein CONCODRAFT_7050 [Conidiobolus coronatus NRRL 28638]|eukprot:KXN70361.1 hypothetical protein CONCODRAFT_7050 [Conidiobolus coronatus NRRL 28638]
MKSYFLYFHPQCVLFNLSSFSTKTVSESLLSAIYYGGFLMQQGHHEEVVSYMHAYAICNIKKILHNVKLSSVQALGIYACAFNRNRNPDLSRVCLHHLFRMADAMGLSINRKNIPALDQYNRRTIYTEIIIHKNWTKLGTTIYSTLPEEHEENIDIHDPKYQLPNPDLNLHNNDHERIIYSTFCIELRKNHKQLHVVNNIFSNYEFNRRDMEIDELSIKTNEIYNNSKASLDYLINLYPQYGSLISRYILLVKIIFLVTSINIYYNTIESIKSIKFSAIESIIDKCIDIHEMLISNKNLVQVCSYFSLNASFHLIKVYPHGTKKQRIKIHYTLQKMIHFYIVEGFDINSLDFIILKTQFDLLNKNN